MRALRSWGTAGVCSATATVEPLESRRLLAAILSGQTIAGSIATKAEVDTYEFNGTAGGSVLVTAGDRSGTAFYPLAELFAPSGTRLAVGYGQTGAAAGHYNLPATGKYKVTIKDYYAATPGNYNITVASFPGAQQAGGDGGAIASGQTRAGNVALGDLDVFTFAGKAGGTALVSVGDTSGTAFYPLVELFAPNGKRLSLGYGQTGAATGNYNLPTTGTYYAVVRDYYAATPGNYNVTVASLGGAQQTGGDAGPIASGATRAGGVPLGDLDVFTFAGTAGGTALVTAGDTAGTAFYPLVELFDPAGKRIQLGYGQTGGAVAHYNLPTTGTYYAVVRDYYAATAGTYNVTAVSMPAAQQTGGDGGFLPSGVTRSAKITIGDRDVHPFYAVTGDKLNLVVAEVGASAFYPLLELFGPDGKRVVLSYGQAGATVNVASATKTGLYYAVVSDYYAASTGSYTIKLTETPSATKPTVGIAATKDATEGVTAPGTFVISRTNIRALPVTVRFAITGTAKNGIDYATIPTSVVLPANVGSVTVQVKPVNDTLDEPNETVILTLSSNSAYNINSTKRTATVRLIDNDPAATLAARTALPPLPGLRGDDEEETLLDGLAAALGGA